MFELRNPLENLYQIGDKINKMMKKPRTIGKSRVISIGNISTGGTGKTPMTQWLASLLKNSGYKVAILTRGYGGTIYKTGGLLSDGKEVYLSEIESGDEPYLLAVNLPGVPVAVGRDRHANGVMLSEKFDIDFFILDDGFQHYALQRALDIVLIDATRPFGNGHIIPLGNLREEPTALARSGIIVITKSDLISPEELQALREKLSGYAGHNRIYSSMHSPKALVKAPADYSTGERPDWRFERLAMLKNQEVWALSGIGNHRAFEETLRRLGASEVKGISFRDHHRYNEKDIDSILKRVSRQDIVVTTEKDWIRLRYFREKLQVLKKFYFMPIELTFVPGELDQIREDLRVSLQIEV